MNIVKTSTHFLVKYVNNSSVHPIINEYRTTSNLTDVSNYSDSFANYFLISNCTVHSKLPQLVVL